MAFCFGLFSPRHHYKNYVLIDNSGCCIGFKTCARHPGGKWVETEEINLTWLNKPFINRCSPPPSSPHPKAQNKRHSHSKADCFCFTMPLCIHTYKHAAHSHQYHNIFTLHTVQNQSTSLSMGSTLNYFNCIAFTSTIKQRYRQY